MQLENQRHLYEMEDGQIYLNCANMAPQLKSVAQAGVDAMAVRNSPWQIQPANWFDGVERVRSLAARVFGAQSEDIAIIPSASYGLAVAARNMTVERDQSIVVLDGQFPSNYYVWKELAENRGAELKTVRLDGADTWTQPLLEAINDSTAVVSVPNCHWTDGRMVDLLAVSDKCRQVGAALVVDNSQSMGAMPFDLDRIDPDFVVTVGYKWLMGPYGISYLYAAPRYHENGLALEHNWYARQGSEDFSKLADYTDHHRAGARRFDMGEIPHFVLMPMAEAALTQVLDWGVDNIADTSSALNAYLDQLASVHGIETVNMDHRVGHITGIRLGNKAANELGARLRQSNIHVSIRGDAIRLSPHVYNSKAEIEQFIEHCKRAI